MSVDPIGRLKKNCEHMAQVAAALGPVFDRFVTSEVRGGFRNNAEAGRGFEQVDHVWQLLVLEDATTPDDKMTFAIWLSPTQQAQIVVTEDGESHTHTFPVSGEDVEADSAEVLGQVLELDAELTPASKIKAFLVHEMGFGWLPGAQPQTAADEFNHS